MTDELVEMTEGEKLLLKREQQRKKRESLAAFRVQELHRKRKYHDEKRIEKMKNNSNTLNDIVEKSPSNVDIEEPLSKRRKLNKNINEGLIEPDSEIAKNCEAVNVNPENTNNLKVQVSKDHSFNENGEHSCQYESQNDSNKLIISNPDLDRTKSYKNKKQNIIERLNKTIKLTRAREEKLRRENKKLNEVIKRKNATISKWKMKYHRLLNKNEDNVLKSVKKIEHKGSKEIRKKLFLHEAFIQQLKEKQLSLKGEKERSVFSQCLAGKVLKKYRLMNSMKHLVSTKTQKKYANSKSLNFEKSRTKKIATKAQILERVQKF
ncbi:reticulocyte-binding protein 2 homolog a-like [Leptopilina heterotoma]|uniref:reticulocyte-binding protein 2 homolog a-like n=1 Tax=Leptopilina heterotoma TaxID=63436 RepID=UPI001CA96757|nr:reticulocyte-binding protein 2 homolog a-like [Leptopilina heterotoma]